MSALPPGSDGDVPEDKNEDTTGETAEHAHQVDVEAAWADIVAHWDAEPATVGSWPAQEDLDPVAPGSSPGSPEDLGDAPAAPSEGRPGEPPGRDRTAGPPGRHRRPADPAGADDLGGRPRRRASDTGPDPEDRFVPPEPPPLARAGWRTWLPWLGVLGAPAFFLVIVLVQPALPGYVLLGVVLAFVAGFVTLVLRMPAHRDDDDDDGAVV